MDRYPEFDRHPGGLAEHGDETSLLEDHTRRIAGGSTGRRLGMSMPGAIAGAFLVTALALGAALSPNLAIRDETATRGGDAAAAGDLAGAGSGGGALLGQAGSTDDWAKVGDDFGKDGEPGSEPIKDEHPDGDAEPGDKPASDEPTDAPKDEPTPQPEAKVLGLELKLDGAKVVVDWTACEVDGFRAYKIIRSTNDAARWPMGTGDSLAGVVEDAGKTIFVDAKAPAGKKLWYKVVALAEREGTLAVVCTTQTKGITTKPAPTDPPATDGATIALEIGIVEGHPKLVWGECAVDFDYYKVVRSTDSTVTWPAGSNDVVVGVVGPDGNRKVYDGDAPAGKKLYYRVFCVRSSGEGYVVVGKSATKSVTTPSGEPKPEPYVLGFTVVQTADGVVLEWEACNSDGFAFYKVVRSMTNTKPNYPLNDGTEVIAAFEDHTKTRFVDTNVEPGQTWYYRVVSMGYWNGQKVTLGYTPVGSLTVQ